MTARQTDACKPERWTSPSSWPCRVREERVLRSNVGFMALAWRIARPRHRPDRPTAADEAGASYYAIIQPSWLRVHLTSRLHNPDDSAHLRSFLEHVDVAISVHGFGRDGFALWLDPDRGLIIEPYGPALRGNQKGRCGGSSWRAERELVEQLRAIFEKRFQGYHVADERVRLGFHPDNPVNLPSRPMASRSSCLQVCAELAISAQSWFLGGTVRQRGGRCACRAGDVRDQDNAHDADAHEVDARTRLILAG